MMKQRIVQLLTLLIGMQMATASFAGKIHDPTKPKRAIITAVELTDAVLPTAETVNAEVPPPVIGEGLQLQSIMRSKKGHIAIISGELVNEGDKFRDYVIGKINADHVVILGSGQQKRLYIYE